MGKSKKKQKKVEPTKGSFVTQARQGDVFIKRVDALPKDAVAVQRDPALGIVLAYGEVTGHAHRIVDRFACQFRSEAMEKKLLDVKEHNGVESLRGGPQMGGFLSISYLQVDPGQTVTLKHDEHDPVVIGEGTYEIHRQRQYTPAEIKQVVD